MGSVIDNPTIKKHSLYKDSGVKWLEKIPSNWHSKPLFTIGKVISKVNCQDRELLSVYLERGVIKFSDVTEKRTNVTSEDLSKYQAVDPGNLVLNNQQAWRGSVGVSKYSGIVSPAYIVLALSDEIDYDFANYLFRDSTMVSHYLICSKGVGTIQRNLYWPQLKRVNVCIPPLTEQTAIAEFLDHKTALIDQAIDIKQKQIELLKERRQILIHNAVTRGLNPNVKMKDSGVEWIGEIPEHWEMKRLKDVCFINLNSLPENTNSNFELNYVDIGSVTLESGIWHTEKYTFKTAPSRARRIAKVGDTVISTVRTYLKAIDFVDQVKSSYIYSTGFALLQPKEFICPEFLGYFVRSDAFTEQVTVNSKGMSYPAINSNDIGRLTVVHCDKAEQQLIIKHIESSIVKIATAISLKEQEIEKLKEYKSTLINSAVTGKIKVYNDAN